jgi:hypothetical protein
LHSTQWSNGKKKKGWKPLFPPKHSIQNSMGSEENEYLVPDLNKKMIYVAKEHSDTQKKKKTSKKKSLRNSWRRYWM